MGNEKPLGITLFYSTMMQCKSYLVVYSMALSMLIQIEFAVLDNLVPILLPLILCSKSQLC